MTVKELIEMLEKVDSALEVYAVVNTKAEGEFDESLPCYPVYFAGEAMERDNKILLIASLWLKQ